MISKNKIRYLNSGVLAVLVLLLAACAKEKPPPVEYVYAGGWGGKGTKDGQFLELADIAVGPQGNVYAVDTDTRTVHVFSGSGSFIAKWYIDPQPRDERERTRASEPLCVATGPDGSVFVGDARTRNVKEFTAAGSFVNEWPYREAVPNEKLYVYGMPPSIAVTADGRVLVGDGASPFVTGYDETGSVAFKSRPAIGGEGSGHYYPAALAVAADGGFWVADTYGCVVKRFNSEGSCIASFGRHGSAPGTFEFPYGVAVSSDGTVFIADVGNERVQYFSPDGSFLGQFGSYGRGAGEFSGGITVAVAPDGTVYVADGSGERILVFKVVADDE